MEFLLEAKVPEQGIFGVKLRMSPDGEEQTIIIIDTSSSILQVDTTNSSLRSDIYQSFPLMRNKSRTDVRNQTAPLQAWC